MHDRDVLKHRQEIVETDLLISPIPLHPLRYAQQATNGSAYAASLLPCEPWLVLDSHDPRQRSLFAKGDYLPISSSPGRRQQAPAARDAMCSSERTSNSVVGRCSTEISVEAPSSPPRFVGRGCRTEMREHRPSAGGGRDAERRIDDGELDDGVLTALIVLRKGDMDRRWETMAKEAFARLLRDVDAPSQAYGTHPGTGSVGRRRRELLHFKVMTF